MPISTIFKLNTWTSYHKELKLSDGSSTYHDEMNLRCRRALIPSDSGELKTLNTEYKMIESN